RGRSSAHSHWERLMQRMSWSTPARCREHQPAADSKEPPSVAFFPSFDAQSGREHRIVGSPQHRGGPESPRGAERHPPLQAAQTAQDIRAKRIVQAGRRGLRRDAQIVSGATQRQAIRSGELRKRLLESEGAVTYETLADMRDSNEKAARQWASRYLHDQRLFTVDAQGRVHVPVFQLNDEGDIDKAVRVPAALVHEKPEVVEEAVNVHIDALVFTAGA